jgi:uncharacterized protein (TIRG00374 family)
VTPVQDETGVPNLWGWRTWASLVIALTALAVMARNVDFGEMWREFLESDKRFALLGFCAHYATYYFRGARWKFVLGHTPRRASRVKYGLVVFFYNFVDNLVPAKLGDLYAAHLARINFEVRRSEALGSLVFLRMIDGWIVLGLAAVSSWALFADHMPALVFWALVFGLAFAVVASGVMVVFVALNRRTPAWLPEKVERMIRDFRGRMVPRRDRVGGVVIFTIVIWSLEVLWMFWLTYAFGLELGLAAIIFLTMIPLLASVVPITPSGAGFVEFTLYACLLALPEPTGISKAMAASITFLNRIIDYWLHIVLGILIWGIRYRLGLYTWRERTDVGAKASRPGLTDAP